ncbi:unnamed protein product [Lymnaea stagnalis]|uniref:Carboxylic ester hydrolase n=1 Tax=Lymnaea stagnalis TaxID=6523 RepID=A0AAV2H8Q4_LYMST
MRQSFTLRLFVGVLAWCAVIVVGQPSADDQYVVRSTKYGQVRGVSVGNGSHKINKFTAIPFGKPTSGNLRFKQPQPVDPWTGTRDALSIPPDCPQVLRFGLEKLNIKLNLSEDCLYLNIYAPATAEAGSQLPVMVWIYGGALIMGSGYLYDGTALAKKGVIVVNFNYRLDAFGFLSTEDSTLPGNYGLLDQILALKWVKENIGNFGGDPNQVTIFGESAGSLSVSLLTVSPLTRGLFKRAIMESGSQLAPWAITYPATSLPPRKIASLIGDKVNCTLGDTDTFVACLQSVPLNDLLDASAEVHDSQNLGMILVPRVEQTFGVLPETPLKLLTSGQYDHIDVIRGFNTNEAGGLTDNFAAAATRDEFREFLKERLSPFQFPDLDAAVQMFEDVYLTNVTDPQLTLKQASDAATDFAFIAPALIETNAAFEATPDKKHYLYEFNYRRSISFLPSWAAAEHADELSFVFQIFSFPLWSSANPPTQDDLQVSDQVIALWTNFAKTGDPTSTVPAGAVKWEPFSAAQPKILKINKASQLASPGRKEAVNLYNKILTLIEKNPADVMVG